MRKISEAEYSGFADRIGSDIPGAVYPLSVIEGIQDGDIYEDGDDWLIWHTGGFAFVREGCGAAMLGLIYELMTDSSGRRLVLFSNDSGVRGYFSGKPDIAAGKRYFFAFGAPGRRVPGLPDGFTLEETDREIAGRIRGRIVPSQYWGSDGFFTKGKGFCVMHGNEPVSWAFSAAVSSRELDIGVETDERFRGLGLAAAAASRLAEDTVSRGRQPVWACSSENAASVKTAEKIGFVKVSECMTFRKA